jgi:TonB family protein
MKLLRFFAAVVGCSLAFQAFALPQNDAAHPKRLSIEPDVAAGLLKHSVKAEYPESARADHVSGEVHLRIVIDEQGKVIEAAPVSYDESPPSSAQQSKVIEAAPVSPDELPPSLTVPASPEDPRLCEAAVKAVKQWEYRPYLLNGQPVEIETQVVFKFQYKVSVVGGLIRGGAPPPNAAAPKHLRVSAGVMEGNLLKHVDPVYPAMARKMHIQGEVLLQIDVSKNGTLSRVRAISGHPLLTQPAVDAVKQWEYKPFLLNGEPVEVESIAIVKFKM